LNGSYSKIGGKCLKSSRNASKISRLTGTRPQRTDCRATIANLRHAGKIRVIADEEQQRIGVARQVLAACRQENNYNQLMES
jgi:hypothetical protein